MKLDPQRWRRLRTILDEVAELPPDERGARLAELCSDDSELRGEVETMLALEDRVDDCIRAPSKPMIDFEGESQSIGIPAGTQIGSYRIEGVIGSGGMSIVYRASQSQPDRIVALKMLRPSLATSDTLQRFQFEAEYLGRLSHPHVAHVYAAGLWEEAGAKLPWFAMEHVSGALPITEFARNAPINQKLALFLEVCDAVHHGHQKGIVHRDLKPANLLVNEDGRAKVIDFGIARLSNTGDSGELTKTGQMLGTLAYMAPEQFDGAVADVDVRSDVYALGVVLYELLTNELPLDLSDTTIIEVARRVRESAHQPLRKWVPTAAPELEWITNCCLSKDADRRYASASELASDIKRFIKDLPIQASPPSRIYAFSKFARRHRKAMIAATLLLAVLIGWGVTNNLLFLRAKKLDAAKTVALREKQQALEEKTDALADKDRALELSDRRLDSLVSVQTFLDDTLLSISPERRGRGVLLVDVLAETAQSLDETEELQTDVAMELHDSLGRAFYGLGEFVEAARHFERALGLALESKDVDEYTMDRVRIDLAQAYLQLSRHEEAERESRLVYDARRREDRDDADSAARAAVVLAQTVIARGALEEAAELLDPFADAQPLPEVEFLLGAIRTLLLLADGKLDEARELGETVLFNVNESLGSEHPQTVDAMERLGRVLVRLRDYPNALGYLRDAYNLRLELYGTDSLFTWRAASNLSVVLGYLNQRVEQEALLRESLPRMNAELGATHDDVLIGTANLASCLSATGRVDEALILFEEALVGTGEKHGEESMPYLICLNNLGFTNQRAGNLDEAAVHFGELNRLLDSVLQREHYLAASFRLNYGRVLTMLERFEEARPVLETAHEPFVLLQGLDGAQVQLIESLLQTVESGLSSADTSSN